MLNARRAIAWGGACVAAGLLVTGIAWKAFAVSTAPALSPQQTLIRESYQRTLSAITLSDGLDQTEAGQIANVYFWEHISGCGGALDPELQGGIWTSKLRFGVAGTMLDEIVEIDARTGAVWSTNGPAFANLEAFRRDIVDGFATRRER
jgi:hypothetical protein